MKFSLVEVETYFPMRLFLCTDTDVLLIQKKEDMKKVQVEKSTLNLVVNLVLKYLVLQ